MRYSILPIVIGNGISFFEGLDQDVALHLVEVQAYRKTRIMGQGAFASEVPEGDPYVISMAVLREAPLSNNAGNNPDTDRAIMSKDSSVMGGVGGQCFQCYEGAPPDYK